MKIWTSDITIEAVTSVRVDTMVGLLGIEFTEIGDDFLKGKMPVDRRTIQPFGIMHGGASAVLAETLGSVAGNYCIDREKKVAVGLSINTSHIRMAKDGYVYGTARPEHLGRTTQVWEVRIENEAGKLVSLNRLTLSVIDRPKEGQQ